jgi:hypothetical protein
MKTMTLRKKRADARTLAENAEVQDLDDDEFNPIIADLLQGFEERSFVGSSLLCGGDEGCGDDDVDDGYLDVDDSPLPMLDLDALPAFRGGALQNKVYYAERGGALQNTVYESEQSQRSKKQGPSGGSIFGQSAHTAALTAAPEAPIDLDDAYAGLYDLSPESSTYQGAAARTAAPETPLYLDDAYAGLYVLSQ